MNAWATLAPTPVKGATKSVIVRSGSVRDRRAPSRRRSARCEAMGTAARAKTLGAVLGGAACAMKAQLCSSLVESALAVSASAAASYAPAPVSARDVAAQLLVCLVVLAAGWFGIKASLENESAEREKVLEEKVRVQRRAMAQSDANFLEAGDIACLQEEMRLRGVVRINKVLDKKSCIVMLQYINDTLDMSKATKRNASKLAADVFGNVYCKKNRWDLKLAYEEPVQSSLKDCVSSVQTELLQLCGSDAKLVELAALVSDPGSTRQPVHPDTAFRDTPSVYTCFVALQDVRPNMGPTLFIPGSNNAEAQKDFQEAGERGGPVLQRPFELALLSRGDASLFDSRTLHCGTENDSLQRRVLFYFSFQRSGSDNPNASVSTIRNELRGKVTLADVLSA
uniref:Uncharacterized protein n=1 Tax=Erythrolobus australicus TaxID=1077150 RepID=A0A7S1TKN7_9RHOD|mmetsp:Transcript_2640/g.7209  ORF Transcript_2640/g.7209 Transcript_2640/m.7209 type:complete len:396 (+) Transcript_2640:18-1205(+)